MNSTLVTKRNERESGDESDGQEYAPPVAKKCRRSLPETVVTKEIPEYYGGKRVGPGKLPYVQNLGVSSSYSEKAKELTLRYLVSHEVRKLETHHYYLCLDGLALTSKSAIVLWLWRAQLAIWTL